MHTDVIQEVMVNRASPPGLLGDYTDGAAYTNNSYRQTHTDCLLLHLYIDGVDIYNQVASAKKKHKVTAVYISARNTGGGGMGPGPFSSTMGPLRCFEKWG